MTGKTSYDLERFIEAQEKDYETALAEIKAGRKRSHWMWYIFPQINGLGYSEISKFYAIKDLAEAGRYLRHPVLGSRLAEICSELLKAPGNNATAIFGSPDDMKLKSCMTLFNEVAGADVVFLSVLEKFFNGAKDEQTLKILGT
jgi:uncharacterized protein (DUF1810 family)